MRRRISPPWGAAAPISLRWRLLPLCGADVCEIYTDVDGVYSADPNIVPTARRLARISYEEMLELARLGAKVLQARSVLFAMQYDVPLVVKSSFAEGEGTLITKPDQDMERVVVSGVAADKNQAKITLTRLPDRPGIAGKLFGCIAAANIVVDMIIQNASDGGLTDISFTVPRPDAQHALTLAQQLLSDLGAEEATLQTRYCQGLHRRRGHAKSFRGCGAYVSGARRGEYQYFNDQHLRD